MDKKTVIEIASKYIKEAKKIFNFNEAYLFGSRINDSFSEMSDIDIAFVLNEDIGTQEYFNYLSKLYELTESINVLIEPHIIIKSSDRTGFTDKIYSTGKKIA
ncbi:MAG: nucleotidyltransferase family protein [Candidatus Muiribacteriota bacterium]